MASATKERAWYSTAEAADILGCTAATIRNYIKSGVLPSMKKGNRWLVAKNDVDEMNDSGGDEEDGISANTITKAAKSPISRQIASTLESTSLSDWDSAFAQWGKSEERIEVTLSRLTEPKGFLRTYDHMPRLDEVKEEWGGGTYELLIIHGEQQARLQHPIAGEPREDGDRRDLETIFDKRKRGRNSHFAEDESSDTQQNVMVEVVKTLREDSGQQVNTLTRMMDTWQERAEADRQMMIARMEAERKASKDEFTMRIQEMERKAELERERERERHEREMMRERERLKHEREMERERMDRERESERGRIEREREREQQLMTAFRSLDGRREELNQEHQAKMFGVLEGSIANGQKVLDQRGELMSQEASLQREFNDKFFEMQVASLSSKEDDDKKASITQQVITGLAEVASKWTAGGMRPPPHMMNGAQNGPMMVSPEVVEQARVIQSQPQQQMGPGGFLPAPTPIPRGTTQQVETHLAKQKMMAAAQQESLQLTGGGRGIVQETPHVNGQGTPQQHQHVTEHQATPPSQAEVVTEVQAKPVGPDFVPPAFPAADIAKPPVQEVKTTKEDDMFEKMIKDNEMLRDFFTTMSEHSAGGLPPAMIGELLVGAMEEDGKIHAAITIIIPKPLDKIIELMPSLEESVKAELLSDRGRKFYGQVRDMLVETFHHSEETDQPDANPQTSHQGVPG